MNQRSLALVAALLAVVFLVLNFTVEDQGTLFLVLTVVAAVVAVYLYARPGRPSS